MKRLFIFLPLLILLAGCSFFNKEYNVAIQIDENDNTEFVLIGRNSSKNYFQNIAGTEITGRYFLLQDTDKYIDVESITSSNTNVIEITDIDYDNYTFTAVSKMTGEAKIIVKTKDYGSSTSLVIRVY